MQYPNALNATVALIDSNVKAGKGDKIALYYEGWPLGRPTGKVTYKELMEMVNRVGNALKGIGIDCENRVAIMMYDSIEYVASFFGCIKIGAIPVPMPTTLASEGVEYLLEDSGARAIIIAEELQERVEKARDKLKRLKHVVVIGEPKKDGLSYDALIAGAAPTSETEETHKDDMAFILYSSGTTGTPKGVVHLQHDMLAICDTYSKNILEPTEHDIFLSTWRDFFAAGLCWDTCFPFRAGAASVIWPGNPPGRLGAEDFLELIQKYKVTLFGAVPTFLIRMLEVRDVEKRYDLSSLRLITSGAEPVPAPLYYRCKERFGVELIDTCGSTECLHTYMSSRPGAGNKGSLPVPGFEIRLIDEAGDEIVQPGKPGKLLVKGESVANLYWRKHEETKRAFIGAWFDTDDTWYKDETQHYWYLGRADEMIKQRGMWVSPKKVEDVLIEHPAILEAAVVQSYSSDDGRPLAKASIVLKEGYEPGSQLENELMEFTKAKLPSYERPYVFEFIDELPRLHTGKVSRLILKQKEEDKLIALRKGLQNSPTKGSVLGSEEA